MKLDNLAIFYIGIKNKEGAATEDDFSVLKNVLGVRMRARATGDFRFVNLNLDANLKRHAPKKKKKNASDDGGGGTTTDPNGSQGGSGGSDTPQQGGSESGDNVSL